MIYLDNNATTPLATEVVTVMCRCLRGNPGNPSSGHSFGISARKAVEDARGQAAALIGSRPEEIIFTSGGTESNNLAIFGIALRHRRGHIITSAVEHPSVLHPLKHLEGMGFRVTRLPVDRYGIVTVDHLEKALTRDTILITVMHANNETGSIQPVSKIGKIARQRSIPFHCDAAQSAGKIPVHAGRMHADLLTVVPHKFYGPKGVGALFVRAGIELKPLLFGASHEKGIRPGTENVAGIAGLGKAAELAKKELKERVRHMNRLSAYLLSYLKVHIPGIRVNGHPERRLPNTLNLSFPGITGSAMLDRLGNAVAASTGSACHEGLHTPSPVLKAMGLSSEQALSAVRLSLGRDTTETEIRSAARAIVKAYRSF